MKESLKTCYRVECNFGCKYFAKLDKAKAYFDKKVARHLDVELWVVSYCYCNEYDMVCASQDLLLHSGTTIPKC